MATGEFRDRVTRRAVLGGLLTGVAGAALADAPLTSPRPGRRPGGFADAPPTAKVTAAQAADLIAAAKLGGEITYVVADAKTGLVLEALGPDIPMPPASTAKTITSLYALEHLGREFRFPTRLLATGPVTGGRLEGDLILAGGGSPVLSTDDLGDMAAALKAAGLRRVAGRFRVWGGALPYLRELDPDQPDYFGYNPCVSGINLNFNRVNFAWAKTGGDFRLGMDARGERFVPEVTMAGARLAERDLPIFTYDGEGPREMWSVARSALNKEGSRWLPVRRPEAYAGDVFRVLARAQGISLPEAEVADGLPEGARVLLERQSDPLPVILKDMLKFSTNLTAEAVGMTASMRRGITTHEGSARAMTEWLQARAGVRQARFADHSGLGGASRISAGEMVRTLVSLGPGAGLRGLMKDVPLNEKGKPPMPGVLVSGKTGTLNFVSALVGYMTCADGAELAYAIFTGDVARRDAVPDDQKEDPPGGAAWVRRSKTLQRGLLTRWAAVYGV